MQNTTANAPGNGGPGLSGGMDRVKDEFGKVKSDVASMASSAADTVKDKAGEAQKYAEQQIEALVKVVKDRPVTSALVGIGIGFLLAKLLSR